MLPSTNAIDQYCISELVYVYMEILVQDIFSKSN